MTQRCYDTSDEQEAMLQWLADQQNTALGPLDDQITADDIAHKAVDNMFANLGVNLVEAKRQALIRQIALGERDDLLQELVN